MADGLTRRSRTTDLVDFIAVAAVLVVLVAPFREHHRDPMLMTRHGFLELTGSSFRGLAPLLGLFVWQGSAAAYCVTSGWMNPLCDRLKLWTRAEAVFAALGLPVNGADRE